MRSVHADATVAFGGGGYRYIRDVYGLIARFNARTLLDYGCGTGTLKRGLGDGYRILEYDPGVLGKDVPPKQPVDLVVCTDVLEHIEPECLDAVVQHIYSLTRRACLMAIATRPSNVTLPDGRNAHLTIGDADYWLQLLARWKWKCEIWRRRPDLDLVVVLRK